MSRHYNCDFNLQQDIIKGVNKLADYVASTLGPRGRNVILKDGDGAPIITKDGVTVAEFVKFENPFEDAAAQVIKQASRKTNSEAGDGTTTATVLARSMLIEAYRHITAGASPIEIQRGMREGVKDLVDQLSEISSPIRSEQDIAHVATISANNDKLIGALVARAITAAGMDGSLIIEEARSVDTTLDLIEGFRFDSGFASSAFINNERRGAIVYEDAFVLVVDDKIDKVQDLLPVLEPVAREQRPLIIVASEIEGQALAALIMNAVRGTMKVAAIKAPRYGEERRNVLKDLALSVGGTFMSRESGKTLRDITLADFGKASTVEITKRSTTIVDGEADYDEVEKRIEDLKTEMQDTESIQECEQIQERITRLASGVAIIHVGAHTEVEMIEKKHRLEDALEAVKSAQEEGVVPGGGSALVKIAKNLTAPDDLNQDQLFGFEIVKKAVQEPARQMAKNAGLSPDLILSEIEAAQENCGYNFSNNEVCDLYDTGIIDPAKVTRVALQNAASVSSSLILANFAIVQTE